jgi:hypothetical protein
LQRRLQPTFVRPLIVTILAALADYAISEIVGRAYQPAAAYQAALIYVSRRTSADQLMTPAHSAVYRPIRPEFVQSPTGRL